MNLNTVIQPLQCSQYSCGPLHKSQSSKPPGEGEAVRQESCLFNVGCECNGHSAWDKKPSLSLDPPMQSVAPGPSTNKGYLCCGKIIEDRHRAKRNNSLCGVGVTTSAQHIIHSVYCAGRAKLHIQYYSLKTKLQVRRLLWISCVWARLLATSMAYYASYVSYVTHVRGIASFRFNMAVGLLSSYNTGQNPTKLVKKR